MSDKTIGMPLFDPFDSEAAASIYVGLGRAMGAWGALEQALAALFCALINWRSNFPTVHAFWAVASFEGKLKMTDAVANVTLSPYPDLSSRWGTMNNKLLRKSKYRNKLAHGAVQFRRWQNAKGVQEDCYFVPTASSTRTLPQ